MPRKIRHLVSDSKNILAYFQDKYDYCGSRDVDTKIHLLMSTALRKDGTLLDNWEGIYEFFLCIRGYDS